MTLRVGLSGKSALAALQKTQLAKGEGISKITTRVQLVGLWVITDGNADGMFLSTLFREC